jgi:hypothetical protein
VVCRQECFPFLNRTASRSDDGKAATPRDVHSGIDGFSSISTGQCRSGYSKGTPFEGHHIASQAVLSEVVMILFEFLAGRGTVVHLDICPFHPHHPHAGNIHAFAQ